MPVCFLVVVEIVGGHKFAFLESESYASNCSMYMYAIIVAAASTIWSDKNWVPKIVKL